MASKSRECYREALLLIDGQAYNGAASRAYYALFTAIVLELRRMGRVPSAFDTAATDPEKWLHSVVRVNSKLAGIQSRDVHILQKAWTLRVKSDYKDESVTRDELAVVMRRLPDMLEDVGVEMT